MAKDQVGIFPTLDRVDGTHGSLIARHFGGQSVSLDSDLGRSTWCQSRRFE